MDAEANRAAAKRLQMLANDIADRPLDLAIVLHHLGYAYLALDEFSEARKALGRALELGVLPSNLTHSIQYLMAQLCVQVEAYEHAVIHLENWFASETDPKAPAHVLAGRAYYALGRYPEAVAHLQQALATNDTPEESWYQLLAVIYSAQQQFSALEPLLQTAIRDYPNNNYFWQALANLYLKRQREDKALAVLLLADRQEILEEPRALTHLAHLAVHLGIPDTAARLLQRWQSRGQLLPSDDTLMLEAQSWLAARERDKAQETLLQAARLSRDGRPHFMLSKLLYAQQRWSEALHQAQLALRKGGLKNSAEAQFMLGLAAYHAGKLSLALATLEDLRDDTDFARQAADWLARISRATQAK